MKRLVVLVSFGERFDRFIEQGVGLGSPTGHVLCCLEFGLPDIKITLGGRKSGSCRPPRSVFLAFGCRSCFQCRSRSVIAGRRQVTQSADHQA
jgi:hypothetical protein